MNFVLFGFKNSGKSTFGKLIAEKLKRPFVDTDIELEQAYYKKSQTHLSTREIYKKEGEKAFRALEQAVLLPLLDGKNQIIAVGGGCVLDPLNREVLEKIGPLVYLKWEKETLKERLLWKGLPAFLEGEDSFEALYKERVALYEAIFTLSIDLEKKTKDQILLELEAVIRIKEES